jgi:hypothetical protein
VQKLVFELLSSPINPTVGVLTLSWGVAAGCALQSFGKDVSVP